MITITISISAIIIIIATATITTRTITPSWQYLYLDIKGIYFLNLLNALGPLYLFSLYYLYLHFV